MSFIIPWLYNCKKASRLIRDWGKMMKDLQSILFLQSHPQTWYPLLFFVNWSCIIVLYLNKEFHFLVCVSLRDVNLTLVCSVRDVHCTAQLEKHKIYLLERKCFFLGFWILQLLTTNQGYGITLRLVNVEEVGVLESCSGWVTNHGYGIIWRVVNLRSSHQSFLA